MTACYGPQVQVQVQVQVQGAAAAALAVVVLRAPAPADPATLASALGRAQRVGSGEGMPLTTGSPVGSSGGSKAAAVVMAEQSNGLRRRQRAVRVYVCGRI
ncbi:hypothetical protein ABIA33_004932 [Streptacidiphilus sp. MAP12-16]|uniref:hypothetical protein n=1 Tax=Streptacidiphilus sp. MAP12-16 TaxID=3156300 RepID=UPI0035197067